MNENLMNSIAACDESACAGAAASGECVWTCGRGRTQLCCQLLRHSQEDFEVEVVRNGRLYGAYRFIERPAAIVFASRLRETFEGNGWTAAQAV
jgi:hypothetical protein